MSPDERAIATLPAAAALVCAVADHDPDEVAKVLAGVTDWQALAVVLAGHVPPDSPLGVVATLSPEQKANAILRETAIRFGLTTAQIRSQDRHREVVDARACAMAAMRYAGLSTPFIGRQVERDHTTVLHAAGRVGENAHLRAIALSMAGRVGGARPADEPDGWRHKRYPRKKKEAA